MKNKTKLKELKQTNGALEYQPTTLNQIWGDDGLSKYNTLDEQQYSADLQDMNKSDLFAHAAKLGIMPIDNRDRLVKALVKEFKGYVANYRRPKFVPAAPKKVSKEIEKILAEGR